MPPSGASFVGAARLDDDEEIARVAKMREELEGIFMIRRICLGEIGINAKG
jgi:hypothetical protein